MAPPGHRLLIFARSPSSISPLPSENTLAPEHGQRIPQMSDFCCILILRGEVLDLYLVANRTHSNLKLIASGRDFDIGRMALFFSGLLVDGYSPRFPCSPAN